MQLKLNCPSSVVQEIDPNGAGALTAVVNYNVNSTIAGDSISCIPGTGVTFAYGHTNVQCRFESLRVSMAMSTV